MISQTMGDPKKDENSYRLLTDSWQDRILEKTNKSREADMYFVFAPIKNGFRQQYDPACQLMVAHVTVKSVFTIQMM